jgi:hypothetical protein
VAPLKIVCTGFSEEHIASAFKVKKIRERGTSLSKWL